MEQEKIKVILYTDGGARPNPGKIGSGLHGYAFDVNYVGKTIAFPHNFTQKGYTTSDEMSIDETARIVLPIRMFDAFFSFDKKGTNNIAEMQAIIRGVKFVLESIKPFEIQIFTDSMVSIQLFESLARDADRCKKRSSLDKGTLQEAHDLLVMLDKFNVILTLKHIKAHSYFYGNQLADTYATLGIHRNVTRCETTEDIRDYIAPKTKKISPLVSGKFVYFETGMHVPGQYKIYNLDDEDWVGRIDPDDMSYSLVQLKDPDPVLEQFIDSFTTKMGSLIKPAVLKLKNIRLPKNRILMNIFQQDSFINRKGEMTIGEDVAKDNKHVVANMIHGNALGIEAENQFNFLKLVLSDVETQCVFQWIDITDLLYTDTKAGGVRSVPNTTKQVVFKYKGVKEKGFKVNFKLNLNHALPSPQQLNKITKKDEPKVYLVLMWSSVRVEFATVSHIGDSILVSKTSSSEMIKVRNNQVKNAF